MALPALKLTYFNIQGAAEKVRLALTLGRIPFEDHRVPFAEWAALKPQTPYGQLPLLSIDGGEPMAQSDAMLRYVGTLATTVQGVPLYRAEDMLAIEEALGLVGDLQRDWRPPVGIALDPSVYGHTAEKGSEEHGAIVEKVRKDFMATSFPKYMGFLAAKLERGGGGFLIGGATPTIADCALVPVLNRFTSGDVDHVPKDCLESFPSVTVRTMCHLNDAVAAFDLKRDDWHAGVRGQIHGT
jgi:glutathione S-transferase